VAIGVLAWRPIEPPPPLLGVTGAIAAGTAAGALLFVILARRIPPLVHAAVARTLLAASPVVVVAAASEEVVWRYAVLGGLRALLGLSLALPLAAVAFALAHVGRAPPRVLWVHVLTGSTFAVVYVATGRLAAAIAAHAAYNLLVVAACSAWTTALQPEAAA
jgi:membrane protease YdiL (CAAX protease family)